MVSDNYLNNTHRTLSRHQWIFITDTVDAIYRPDNWFPDAVMDQLSETVGELPASETRVIYLF